MYRYIIDLETNRRLFDLQCKQIEEKMQGIVKEKLLEDVDGSLIQSYAAPKGIVDVYNDEQLNELYIQSEFELLAYGVLLRKADQDAGRARSN